MAKYIALCDWTDKGVQAATDTVERARQATETFKQRFGVTIEKIYWTAGQHDLVAIVDAPDDASLSAALLMLARSGNVRTQTLRAYEEQEMQQILGRIGS